MNVTTARRLANDIASSICRAGIVAKQKRLDGAWIYARYVDIVAEIAAVLIAIEVRTGRPTKPLPDPETSEPVNVKA